jgi:hypothetical protein
MANKGPKEKPRKHFCRKHDAEAYPMALGFKFKIRYVCAKGCQVSRKEVYTK